VTEVDLTSAAAQTVADASPAQMPGAMEAQATSLSAWRRVLRPTRVAVTTIFLVNGTAIGFWAAHIPLLKNAHGLSEQRLSVVLLGFALGAIATMVMSGWLSARWGSGRVTLVASLAFCAALPLPSLSPTLPALFAAAVLLGGCNGAMDVAMNAYATTLERAWRAPIMSSFHAFFSLGGLTGAALSSLLIVRGFGATMNMPLAGATLALVVIATARLLWKEEPTTHAAHLEAADRAARPSDAFAAERSEAAPRGLGLAAGHDASVRQEQEQAEGAGARERAPREDRAPGEDDASKRRAPRLALPSKGLVRLGAVAFCAAIAEGAMVDWTGVYLSTVLGAAAAFAAGGFAACSLSMTIGRLAGDKVIARLGRRETLTGSGALAACGLALAVLAGAPFTAALGFGLAGFGLANIIPIVFADAGHAIPSAPGLGVATVATMGYAGFLLGPPAIGFTAGLVGLRLAMTLLVIAAVLISLLGLKHPPQPQR
jgi:MFS family permease